MALLFLFGPVFGLVCFVLGVFFTRWVFRINRILRTLESIDRSLQYLAAIWSGRLAAGSPQPTPAASFTRRNLYPGMPWRHPEAP